MNGKFAWPSVAVYRGGTFSRRSIIKCDTNENFGALMERLEVNLGSETVAEVTISAQQKKDANHILIPQVICLFISVSKLLTFWYRYEKNRSLVKSKYDLRLYFAVRQSQTISPCIQSTQFH